MIQGGISAGDGIQWCIEICRSVHWYAEEHRDAWLYAMVHGTTQQNLGALLPRKPDDWDVRHTMGSSLPKIEEWTYEHHGALHPGWRAGDLQNCP